MTETGSSQERKALKRRIRREVLAVRDALSEEALRRASCLITERLLGHQWFYRAESLLCYVSYGSELDTHELLQEALRLGKRVYVPRVLEDHGMEFFQIGSLEELRPGFHGILEPPRQDAGIYRDGGGAGVPALGDGQEPREKVLLLMPGVAFDPYGHRLGDMAAAIMTGIWRLIPDFLPVPSASDTAASWWRNCLWRRRTAIPIR